MHVLMLLAKKKKNKNREITPQNIHHKFELPCINTEITLSCTWTETISKKSLQDKTDEGMEQNISC